jgi:ligand-binding SRPBCC domain-containing protein
VKPRTFHSEQWLPRPAEEVFTFFADARNLQVLTPGWLDFSIVTAVPAALHPGVIIDYRLRLHGFPLRWQS